MFPRNPRDRPHPPLPLNITRHLPGYVDSSTAASSPLSTPGKRQSSVVSSLKALRNPFSRRRSTPSSPATSLRSSKSSASARSSRSSGSRSSTSTLPVAFYPNTFWQTYGSDSALDEKGVMEKVRSSGAAEKVTDKFPVISRKKMESWTGYKWVLLLSVIAVGPWTLLGEI